MKILKFTATKIFDGRRYLPDETVVITAKDGTVLDIVAESEAGDDVQRFEGIISPGFVNCHCHLELSHMKNKMAEGGGLIDFLIKVVKQRSESVDVIQSSIADAVAEMHSTGTVAVGDISNTGDTIPVKQEQKMKYYNFLELLGFSDNAAGEVLKRAGLLYSDFAEKLPAAQTSIVPHAPYSVSRKLFELLNETARGKTISIHNQETPDEAELFKKGVSGFDRLYRDLGIDRSGFIPSGKNSIQTYLPYLKSAKNILLVHNTYAGEDDLRFAAALMQSGFPALYWCICIRANLYIENAVPPLEKIVAAQQNIVLGTDSYASNKTMNLLDEMKVIQHSFPGLSLETILSWATVNGAEALQMQDEIGAIEKKKRPGLVLTNQIENGRLTHNSTSRRIV